MDLVHDLVDRDRIVGHVANDVLNHIIDLQRVGALVRGIHARIAAGIDVVALVEQLLDRSHIVERPFGMLRVEGHEQLAQVHRDAVAVEDLDQRTRLVDAVAGEVEMMLLLRLDAEQLVSQRRHDVEDGVADVGEQVFDRGQYRLERLVGVAFVTQLRSHQHGFAASLPVVGISQGGGNGIRFLPNLAQGELPQQADHAQEALEFGRKPLVGGNLLEIGSGRRQDDFVHQVIAVPVGVPHQERVLLQDGLAEVQAHPFARKPNLLGNVAAVLGPVLADAIEHSEDLLLLPGGLRKALLEQEEHRVIAAFRAEGLDKLRLLRPQIGELLDDLLHIELLDGDVHHAVVDALEIAHTEVQQLDVDRAQRAVHLRRKLLERQVEIGLDGAHLEEHRHEDHAQPQVGDLRREVV